MPFTQVENLFALLLLFLETNPAPTIKLVEASRLEALAGGHYLDNIFMVHMHGRLVFGLDRASLAIFCWDTSNHSLIAFAGKGQAPGELRSPVVAMFVEDETLHVIHGGGQQRSVFDFSGENLFNQHLVDCQRTLFQNQKSLICEEDGYIQTTPSKNWQVSGFSPAQYGFGRVTGVSKTAFLVGAETSNIDTIALLLFDLNGSNEILRFDFDKKQKNFDRPLPAYLQNIRSQRSAGAKSYLTGINRPINLENGDFSVAEFSVHEDFYRGVSVVHFFSIRPPHHRICKMIHPGISAPIFFAKIGNQWASFDTADNVFLLMNVVAE